jgi:hypothetical protein
VASRLRDLKRLQEIKDRLAALPPERRKRVAKMALLLHLQRKAGIATSSAKTPGTGKPSPTKPGEAT